MSDSISTSSSATGHEDEQRKRIRVAPRNTDHITTAEETNDANPVNETILSLTRQRDESAMMLQEHATRTAEPQSAVQEARQRVAQADKLVKEASEHVAKAQSAVEEAHQNAAGALKRMESAIKDLDECDLKMRAAQKSLRELESKNELSHDKVPEEALVKAKSDYQSLTQDYLRLEANRQLAISLWEKFEAALEKREAVLEKREIALKGARDALKDAQAVLEKREAALQASEYPQPRST